MKIDRKIVLKVMRLPHAEDLALPAYQSSGAAGFDLSAAVINPHILRPNNRFLAPTGLCLEIPIGFEAQIRPRSGLALKYGVTVLNTPGTIDSDYRGEVKILLVNLGDEDFAIERGMRIAQLVVAPITQATIGVVANLSDTSRGDGGFGSTG